jgi:hypothetical protein
MSCYQESPGRDSRRKPSETCQLDLPVASRLLPEVVTVVPRFYLTWRISRRRPFFLRRKADMSPRHELLFRRDTLDAPRSGLHLVAKTPTVCCADRPRQLIPPPPLSAYCSFSTPDVDLPYSIHLKLSYLLKSYKLEQATF